MPLHEDTVRALSQPTTSQPTNRITCKHSIEAKKVRKIKWTAKDRNKMMRIAKYGKENLLLRILLKMNSKENHDFGDVQKRKC